MTLDPENKELVFAFRFVTAHFMSSRFWWLKILLGIFNSLKLVPSRLLEVGFYSRTVYNIHFSFPVFCREAVEAGRKFHGTDKK